MDIEQEFRLRFRCPTCDTPCEHWFEGNADDGDEVHFACEQCGEDCVVEVGISPSGDLFASIVNAGHVPVEIDHYDYRYDNWLGGLPPEPHPTIIFREAIADWQLLVRSVGDRRSGKAPINRMLLMQLFAALEAYLSDEIIRLASDREDSLRAIVAWDADLSKQTVSIKRVAAEPDIVRRMAVERLRQTQFHRFEMVDRLMVELLGERFLPSDNFSRKVMIESAYLRHHCVHRNGRDMDGRMVDSITVEYLSALEEIFRSCVERISAKIALYRSA